MDYDACRRANGGRAEKVLKSAGYDTSKPEGQDGVTNATPLASERVTESTKRSNADE